MTRPLALLRWAITCAIVGAVALWVILVTR